MQYLEFEKPIEELVKKLNQAKDLGEDQSVDVTKTIFDLESKIKLTRKNIYENLTSWQRVQLSRHPQRPYALDFVNYLTNNTFLELHGDRGSKDDKAMIGGWGKINDQSVMFIGQQKEELLKKDNTEILEWQIEGYRKALRLMKMAEKFNKPVICLIDTPGAFPGLEAEEKGQGEAIARNILEMTQLEVPIIVVIIGEGASGGALGIGVGNKILMLSNAWYSVISPENCSTILWGNWENKTTAADSLKLTAKDMKKLGLVDEIIKEPLGGAHTFPKETFKIVKRSILKSMSEFTKLKKETIVKNRIDKFSSMGVVNE